MHLFGIILGVAGFAEMLELADRHGSEPCAYYKRAGSTPALSTQFNLKAEVLKLVSKA